MTCCKNCGWLSWVTTTDTSYYCTFIGGKILGDLSYFCQAWKPTAQTNADKIRAMSDEELAYWISDHADCNNRCEAWKDGCMNSDSTCIEAWLDWLKEVDDG